MYRDNLEALQARVSSLDAELEAERKRHAATAAELNAARALLYEQQVCQRLRQHNVRPHGVISPAWPLAMVLAVSAISALYLGMQHARCQNVHRRAYQRVHQRSLHALRSRRSPLFGKRPVVVAIPELAAVKNASWKKCPYLRRIHGLDVPPTAAKKPRPKPAAR